MTTIRGINQSINYFFKKIGYSDVIARYTREDFCYIPEPYSKSVVNYCFKDDEELKQGFIDYLNKTYPNRKKCSMFTFYLLHELGHHSTRNEMQTRKTWTEYRNSLNRLNKDFKNGKLSKRETQTKYCGLYLERIATKKAIDTLNKNYEEILNFEKRLHNLLND